MKNIVIYGLSEGLGGVETIILSLIDKLHNYYCFTIVLSNKSQCQYIDRIHKDVRIVNITRWGNSPQKFRIEFCELLKTCNCDYVWINSCVTSNRDIIEAVRNSRKGIKIITHSHGTNYESEGFIKGVIIKTLHYYNRGLYNQSANLKLACSRKAAKWYYGNSHCNDVIVLRNGIKTERFKYNESIRNLARQKFNCENSFVLLHIGRLSPVKNQTYILRIFHELLKSKEDSKLMIAGTGELEGELKEESVKLNIADKVVFLGKYDNVRELYNLSDAFLLPSIHEGMPLTLVEAQCSGLQCFVSSSISKEVNISSFVSFISNAEKPQVWAKHIIDFNYIDNRELGYTQVVESGFDVDIISKNLIKLIDNA